MTPIRFTRLDVLLAAEAHARALLAPAGVDAYRLMVAIATVESSLGSDCGPRHEPAYDLGGALWKASKAQQMLVARFGVAAACSYGPWQMMFDNFETEDPKRLETDLDLLAQEFVRWFNHWVIGFRKASTLAEIGEVWNSGGIRPDPEYVAKLTAAYAAVGAMA